MYHPKTRWEQLEEADEERAADLAQALNIHPMIARILLKRGLGDKEEAARFLHVTDDAFYDPFRLHGMKEAVARIEKAATHKESIWIYGDYDADGVTGTALLLETFRALGLDVDYYIPNRFTEGYGVHAAALKAAARQGVSLVITVDTGITAASEAELAQTLGMDLIITDHHEPPAALPRATAVINPKQPLCRYPDERLAGAGLAFKLAHALLGDIPEELLPLAALGTIADVVPLIGENRAIAALGLAHINEKRHIGIDALRQVTGLSDRQVTAGHVGFVLGPRLNAGGRLDTATPAVQLLTAADREDALKLAKQLDAMNRERQQLVEEITREAVRHVEAHAEKHRYAIVLAHPDWHIGVLGIVASRLVERFYRPTVVLTIDEASGEAKGSARSIDGFNLYEALDALRGLLSHFGGHKMAAGLTMAAGDVDTFRAKLNALAAEKLTSDDYTPATVIDASCSVEEVQVEWVEQLALLEPFGVGNRTPHFHITGGKIRQLRRIGRDGRHLRLSLETDSARLQGVAFQMGEMADAIMPGANGDVVGELGINEWNGHRSLQVSVKDLAVPHLQVFDWRGRAMPDQLWKRLAQKRAVFVCFEHAHVSRVRDQFRKGAPSGGLPSETPAIICLQERDEISLDVPVFRDLVIVDIPTDVSLYHQVLRASPLLERVYFLGEGREERYIVPPREHFKHVYGALYKERRLDDWTVLPKRLGLSEEAVSFILDVFAQLAFVVRDGREVTLIENPEKRPLEQSTLFQKRKQLADVYQSFYYASASDLAREITKAREGQSPNDQEESNDGFQKAHSHY